MWFKLKAVVVVENKQQLNPTLQIFASRLQPELKILLQFLQYLFATAAIIYFYIIL